jgi:hypothetical protein
MMQIGNLAVEVRTQNALPSKGIKMSKDLLYSSDAHRLLKELEVTASSTRLPALKNPEHVEELHDLFGQVVGLPKDAVVAVKPKSPRMTNNELKAMKVVTNKVETPRFTMLPVLQVAAKFFAQVQDMFKTSKNKGAVACQQKRT